ncbi:hypothetical protein SAMN05444007_106186 [Cribrihabitans marinus]|uniref:Peptidase family M48 n=1 Tax=Cribrihabitans marinus TaxID=1227549 RepID=A0A1H7AV82_9RHOB|nr:hypothetical protein [Cribrihabitans marinus]GGH32618.1 hypothetical protein GCM10010973_24220 [Cribrihabitans marinus]SEJ69523.1 hypothetical protein SAMN05444007_106186 [Cribrihabitans marinus]
MTALTQYDRIEATGLWRPAPEDQRREVIASIGDATLTISDLNDRALTHWSLAALERSNPGQFPAIYNPDGDPGETLELAESETTMIEAIERLRTAIERSRPRPGRLRWASVAAVTLSVAAVLFLWLPGALQRHAVSVVPDIKRQEIGRRILDRVERVAGQACAPEEAAPALDRLAQRTGVRRLVVLPGGIANSLHLPGGIVVLNRTLIEDHEDPAVAAGHILLERARAEAKDPLAELLDHAGPIASFRLLTTGQMTPESLDRYAETAMSAPRPALADDAVLAVFAQAAVPSSPYAYAQDVTGESVLGLIEADPMAGRTLEPVLPDRDWIRLQGICGG